MAKIYIERHIMLGSDGIICRCAGAGVSTGVQVQV